MKETLELLSNYGVGLVIIMLFIYDWFTNKKDIKKTLNQNEKCLEEISISSKNTTKSLDLLQQTMNEQKDALMIHDKRCEKTQYLVEEIKNNIERGK